MKRLLVAILTGIIVATTFFGNATHAADVAPAPDTELSPVYISGFSLAVANGGSSLQVVELYSTASDVINLDGWSIDASSSSESCSIQLSEYLLPKSYGLLAGENPTDQPQIATMTDPGCMLGSSVASSIGLISPTGKTEITTEIMPGDFVRKNITSTYRGGTFDHDFVALTNATNRSPQSFYYGGWYIPTETTPIEIAELLPHSRDCSPNENVMGCQDYVKLYNPTTQDWSLSGLRLRIGYAGQSVTTSNAIVLGGTIPAGGYATFMSKADGSSVSITDSGGWIWLEDGQGIGDPLKNAAGTTTVVEYPSASSTDKVGWAWAHDLSDGTWKWTAKLAASDQPSEFYVPTDEPGKGAVSLTPCRADQYRNPETNRCKLIASAPASLTPCAANQYRNPETNRCRSLATTASSSLTPCKAGQYRNPETNRCKSLAAAASTLKPCAANQERNPETNRCRKVASTMPVTDFAVSKSSPSTKSTPLGWIAFAAVGLLIVMYGVWEWRFEIGRFFATILRMVKKS